LPLDSARPKTDAVTLSLAEDMNIAIHPRGIEVDADRLYAAVDESAARLSRGVQRRLGETSQDGGTKATGRRRR
jgi:hypothetical protein